MRTILTLALLATLACTHKPGTRGSSSSMLEDDERAAGTYAQQTATAPVPIPEEPPFAAEAMQIDSDRRVAPPPQERPQPLPEEPKPPR